MKMVKRNKANSPAYSIFFLVFFSWIKKNKHKKLKKIRYMAKKVELPRKEGVRPASKDIKRFLKRLKNCTTANREASAPTIRFIFNSLSQLSFLINKAAKIGKIKI